ncbi:hypothetical protein T492DRAFT_881624, partial [Pavlovales sp. CCMP2436]
ALGKLESEGLAGDDFVALKRVLLSNRSAAYVRHNLHAQGEADARACIAAAPEWAKGHHRLGVALKAAGQFEQ